MNTDVECPSVIIGRVGRGVGFSLAVDVPTTLVWGADADMPPLSTGRDLAERADVWLVSTDDSMLVPHLRRHLRKTRVRRFLSVNRQHPFDSGLVQPIVSEIVSREE